MKAVLLVGGEGTRLRPLTATIPKPLVPLVDRPFLRHVLDHVAAHGVTEVLLSSPYLGHAFARFIALQRGLPAITWVHEPSPLGTGGAVANAARDLDEAFLVLNGDILTDLDLTALFAFHRGSGGVATIALAAVPDARPYGLVQTDERRRLTAFREKPAEPGPGTVNAGTYVLEPEAVRDVPVGRPVSIERETFPGLLRSGAAVFGFASDAYWLDLGTPEKYLQATFDALEGRVSALSYAAPHVHPTARVSLLAQLGRWVVVAANASVDDRAEVEDSVVLEGARIGAGARVRGSVVGPGATIGAGALVEHAVLAEEAVVPAGSTADGARLAPGRVLGG